MPFDSDPCFIEVLFSAIKVRIKPSMSEDPIVTRRPIYLLAFAGLLTFILATNVLAVLVPKQKVATSGAPQAVILMTYNIQQLGYSNWMANHFEKQRLELIPETILALTKRPDVLILQEVFTQHAFNLLIKRMSEIYPYHTQVVGEDCEDSRWNSVSGNCQASLIRGNGGVMIFSRWPIEQQHAYVFHAGRVSKSFDFLARKGVAYAKIKVQGDKPMALHVFGTHLQASAAEHDIRLLQLDEMRRFIDGFEIAVEEPVILGGDFNISSADESGFKDLLNHALAKVTLPEGGIGSMSDTTNGYRSLLAGSDSEVSADRTLDYLLYRSDHLQPANNPMLRVIDLKSKTPWRGRRLFSPDVELTDLSDHYPAIIEFEF
ncbi:MAG: phospholipase C [Pseudoalteromonas tetraodonis]|jgi:phospholipase C